MLFGLKWFVRMRCFFYNIFITVHVDSTATLELCGILSASPVNMNRLKLVTKLVIDF